MFVFYYKQGIVMYGLMHLKLEELVKIRDDLLSDLYPLGQTLDIEQSTVEHLRESREHIAKLHKYNKTKDMCMQRVCLVAQM